MSYKNGGKSQRNLSNPLSFSSDKINVNNTNSQHYENNSKDKIKIQKFVKKLNNLIPSTNDNLLPLKKNPSIYSFKDLPNPGPKLAYNNLALHNYHLANSSSQPNMFLLEKKQSQNHPQININININNFQFDSNSDNPKFPHILKPNPLTPSTQNKRKLNLKLQNQMKKIDYQREHGHNILLGIKESLLANERITSPKNQRDKVLFQPNNNKKIEVFEDNNTSFINELEEILKNVKGKHPFKPINDNPQDFPFELDIEPISIQNNQYQYENQKQKVKNKRSNRESYHQTANSCHTERPQTSYGGVLMRRFKMRNNLRENSAKHKENTDNNNHNIAQDNGNDYE